MKRLLPLLACLLATAAQGETILSEVSGNWAAPMNDGFYYRAVLSENGDTVRLRIYQGSTPELGETALQLDNPAIARLMNIGVNLANTLSVAEDGSLTVYAQADDESFGFSEGIRISYMDNMFTVMNYTFNATELDGTAANSAEPVTCDVDVWNGRAEWSGVQADVPPVSFEDRNAALWSPTRAYELWLCPKPN